jgi:signal transduction histidine kinase
MKTSKKNQQISTEKIEIDFSTSELFYQQELASREIQKQKLLSQAIIDSQEQERLQIGKLLHDNISQHLNTTRLYLEVAKEKAMGDVLVLISDAHKNLTDIINEVRHLSFSLAPPALRDLGLIEAIKDLCCSLSKTQICRIDFIHHFFNEDDVPYNMKLMLFRLLKDYVNNIIRLTNASEVVIQFKTDAEYIILFIRDNAKLADHTENQNEPGFTNIRDRVDLFNGTASIESVPEEGSTLSITIPLNL